MHVVIIGAGPTGVEAALAFVERGDRVTVVESGYGVGASVRRWGHVQLFSPWRLNASPRGIAALERAGAPALDPDVCPTGEELVDAYLEPLADALGDRVTWLWETDAIAISRRRLLKNQKIGSTKRTREPFRLLIEDADGERYLSADLVLDCSGVLDTPNFVGAGGLPAIGESLLDHMIHRGVPSFEDDLDEWAGKRTLVVGDGMSAVSSLDGLLAVKAHAPKTSIVWAHLGGAEPYTRVDEDPLAERDRLATLGNAIAAGEHPVEVLAGAAVVALELGDGGRLDVTLEGADGKQRRVTVDRLISNTGFRPNTALFEELQVHLCWATQGTMKLAASLLAASGAADCLAQPAPGPELLQNPERDFFVLGAKSYGRNSSYLMRVGVEQVDAVLSIVDARAA